MIIGECPYDDCDHWTMRSMKNALSLPAYAKENCDGCGRPVWVKFSRVDPVAYTEADFEAEHVIDFEQRIITERVMPPIKPAGSAP